MNEEKNRNVFPLLAELNRKVTVCRLCPRLARYREEVPPRRAFADTVYWRRPVPSFGDPEAWLLIVGLAPAAHGGNRTGRVFTGDESGRFLIDILHRTGFASQPTSTAIDDGLVFDQCYVVASVRCAPPDNKPTAQEFENCRAYLVDEMRLLPNVTHVLALGRMAFDAYIEAATQSDARFSGDPVFGHGRSYHAANGVRLYSSYHPSPRNTHTGKLTSKMLVELLERMKKDKRELEDRRHRRRRCE